MGLLRRCDQSLQFLIGPLRLAKLLGKRTRVQLDKLGSHTRRGLDLLGIRRDEKTHVNPGVIHPPARLDERALVPNHILRLNVSAAGGWLHKAKRLLENRSASAAQGALAAMTALVQLVNGEIEAGLENARLARRLGEEHEDRDLVALGLMYEGYALARLGRVDDGWSSLDEAMAGRWPASWVPLRPRWSTAGRSARALTSSTSAAHRNGPTSCRGSPTRSVPSASRETAGRTEWP